jgi:hypothetical protein
MSNLPAPVEGETKLGFKRWLVINVYAAGYSFPIIISYTGIFPLIIPSNYSTSLSLATPLTQAEGSGVSLLCVLFMGCTLVLMEGGVYTDTRPLSEGGGVYTDTRPLSEGCGKCDYFCTRLY